MQLSGGYSLESVSGQIKSNINKYIQEQKNTWKEQLAFGSNTIQVVIREAFIMAAALVPGVIDVPLVNLSKGGVYHSGAVAWETTGAVFEWIDDNTTDITLFSV